MAFSFLQPVDLAPGPCSFTVAAEAAVVAMAEAATTAMAATAATSGEEGGRVPLALTIPAAAPALPAVLPWCSTTTPQHPSRS